MLLKKYALQINIYKHNAFNVPYLHIWFWQKYLET